MQFFAIPIRVRPSEQSALKGSLARSVLPELESKKSIIAILLFVRTASDTDSSARLGSYVREYSEGREGDSISANIGHVWSQPASQQRISHHVSLMETAVCLGH